MGPAHNTLLLWLEYTGWIFEAVGGVLLGWEALFKRRDYKLTKDKIETMTDDAFAGTEWVDGKGHVLTGTPNAKEKLKEQRKEILSERTQSAARWGPAILVAGLLMHAAAKLLD